MNNIPFYSSLKFDNLIFGCSWNCGKTSYKSNKLNPITKVQNQGCTNIKFQPNYSPSFSSLIRCLSFIAIQTHENKCLVKQVNKWKDRMSSTFWRKTIKLPEVSWPLKIVNIMSILKISGAIFNFHSFYYWFTCLNMQYYWFIYFVNFCFKMQ